ncbi:MAG: pyridoxal phosphate-dependent aminotransferase [Muribaculaceae bacterium]|nr:pyridoxal phosphate-dependent aminotransferase [Muribaculaceae bacterium]
MLPITEDKLNSVIDALEITDLTTATIRQICALSAELERAAGEKYVHLELGNPGLPAEKEGLEAECEALKRGVASCYPDIAGIPSLKKAGSDFVKAFIDLDVPPYCIVPTVGSMQGSYTLLTLLKMRVPGKDTVLVFNPGFPAQRQQAKMLGMNVVSFDIYYSRGEKLREKLEEILAAGRVTCMIYSNPNNPTWSNFTQEELKIIGEAATKHDVIVLEDLAYMGMDFRRDYSQPYKSPFIPSVGKYTENYILLISASKIFSYAGQRIGIVCMSPEVFNKRYDHLEKFFEMPNFGECYIYGVLYTASSGTAHSAQYAMAAMLESAVEGKLPFVKETGEYARRSALIKDMLKKNGFHIVYEKDCDEDISEGFFFTAGYKNYGSEHLQRELLRHGISTISLPCTGSTRDGVRICVSTVSDQSTFDRLASRLKEFSDAHPE